jgi:gliding motility-associated-like protein
LAPLPTASLNGISGSWSPALNNTTTTTYTFTPTNGQCAIPVTMTITVNSAASSEFTAAACFLYNLPWGNIVTTSGDYVHTYQTINGCDSIVTAHITINNTPDVTTNATVCVSQLPFVWNGNSYNAPGTYSLNLQNATGCNFIATLILKINTITRSTTNTTICRSQLPFSWNGNTYTAAGSYSVTLQNVGSCDSIAELNLNINDTITSITRDSTCVNQPYVWNGNSYTTSGTYSVNLTSTAGCDSIATLILNVKPIPKIEVKDPPAVCEPLTVDLTAPLITAGSDPGLSYTYWMDSLATIPLTNPNAVNVSGIYYIKAQDVNNCSSTKPVKITVSIYKLIAGLRYPTIITQKNKSTQLTARSIGNVYTWSPPIGLNSSFIKDPVFNYDRETEYRINITIGNGCITVDTVLVKIIPEIPPVVSDLFVPKAWTPNNDGHNDKLFPITVNIRELKYFRIFNRWGQLVFETNSIGEGWNGILQGKPAIMDVYTWTVEAIGVDGKHIKKTGNSVLIR